MSPCVFVAEMGLCQAPSTSPAACGVEKVGGDWSSWVMARLPESWLFSVCPRAPPTCL